MYFRKKVRSFETEGDRLKKVTNHVLKKVQKEQLIISKEVTHAEKSVRSK